MTLKSLRSMTFNQRSTILPALLLLLFFSSCSGSKRTFRLVEKDLKHNPVFEKGFTGVMIYDPEKKKPLYQFNPHKYFTPASNTKLLTFYTGLKLLGDSVPALEYRLQNDSLIFRGTGDPSLLNPYLPPSGVVGFLENSQAELFYLPPKTEETFFGPGWAWDDYNDYYSVERSAFPVYGNEVSFKANQVEELPEVYPSAFRDSLVPDTLLQEKIQRELSKNRFHYPAELNQPELEQTVPFKTSTRTAVALLSDTIGRNIKILKPNLNIDLDRTLFSIPTDSLYKRMLQKSDNFIAEQILMLASREISDTLEVPLAIKHMKKNYLQDLPDEVKWVDGSGLSRYNLTTPANMVSLLEKIQNEVSYERLFHL
ncbi:MAG TPA: D-alanyl-D-alanine carboxypeptidase, partial [Salinimicrobium catena]|nr:D-alanyl-D-alanine carboxypeptidase [Salinimicrobium catena]